MADIFQRIEIREDSDSFLARIIIAGEWEGNLEKAKELFERVYETWPSSHKVKFLITCGGYVQFDWPSSISREDIGDNINPRKEIVDLLVKEAEKCAQYVLDDSVAEKYSEITDYITLGIDSFKEKISTTQNYISQLHIELVFLIDLKNNKFYWTGKSYPTPGQQRGLVRISDLKTHFFNLDVGKVMILGCHDLTIFNPRSKNARGWKERVNREFRELAMEEKPEIVLQHPHTTDSVLTWAAAWKGLVREVPSVRVYASAGKYYRPEGVRSRLNDVLEKTERGNALDFIVWMK